MFVVNILKSLSRIFSAVVFACAFFVGATNASFAACTADQIDVAGDGTNCEEAKFSVTTTNDTSNFIFSMSAAGTFVVDWGDGSVQTIDRTGNTTNTEYSHTYDSTGEYTIKFGGLATGYSTVLDANGAAISFYKASDGTQNNIQSISGSLGTIFPVVENKIPRFYNAFYGCKNLSSVPSSLFTGIDTTNVTDTSYMFYGMFRISTVKSIPSDLFSGINTTNAQDVSYMFFGMLRGTRVASLSSDLFSSIDTHNAINTSFMFGSTFYGTKISAIPDRLFGNIDTRNATDTSNMFNATFSNCTKLTSYIPPSAFPNTIVNGLESSQNMWKNTFADTELLTSCPSGTTQYITGYESLWNTRVSCEETSCTANEMYVNGACETPKFTLTTTNDATQIIFRMSAKGTFYVDCGDGGTLSGTGVSGKTITRNDTTIAEYSCSWTSTGEYTIKFGGTATGYSSASNTADISFYKESGGTHAKIASISGSLSALFPQTGKSNDNYKFYLTFRGCTNLTEIPAGLFSGITTGASYMFSGTFYGCTKLTEIPAELFSGITTGASYMFFSTFYGCTSLEQIPAGLFSGITTGAYTMFYYTFSGCTSLKQIPAGLFSSITTGADSMFFGTFYGCTKLTEIPAELFSGITTGATGMFFSTFYGCTSLEQIPAGLFSGITTGANYMFERTFNDCTSLEQIPAGLFSGITTGANGMFDSTFNGCTNLAGYIPPTTFAGLIANEEHQSATGMWTDIFSNTKLWKECKNSTVEFDTGYKSDWGGYVSCEEVPCSGVMYAGECHQECSVMSTLHAGTYSYPVFADKTNVPSPVLHIRQNDTICYVYFEPDNNSAEHGLKVRWNDTVYHAIDPR